MLVTVRIHHSQFPDLVRRDLLESIRTRCANHKFHYDSIRQAQQWLALHEQYSPARTDPQCLAIYSASFQQAAGMIADGPVHLIGLGCGGGQKEVALLEHLRQRRIQAHFTASDVSTALVMIARERALKCIGPDRCDTLVCDLATADDLPGVLEEIAIPGAQRIITFFGLIPNFEPDAILPSLAAMLQPGDILLFSANLAPGDDYGAGVERILPLYDNQLTRDWLMTFLTDLGVESSDGTLKFSIEEVNGLRRIAVHFEFTQSREIRIDAETFQFVPGERFRLFFSYRHTPGTIRERLSREGIRIEEQWIASSGEEGVFLCRKEGVIAG